MANAGASSVTLLLGDGTGGFSPRQTVAVDRTPLTIGAADLNGDGAIDLVVGCGEPGTVVVLAVVLVVLGVRAASAAFASCSRLFT